ncbi:hypothetical protein GCM10007939_10650 [Amylibacter marinus]|uniref:NADH-quinone oxidoreductase subunit E n=1 Tax=Amylibacter marinus TaxID=1475483 RepID=A0ABQ5VTL3_9RHOB|nr:hypothetical protein GCM10007939_10650 [Amylibacter marinus]
MANGEKSQTLCTALCWGMAILCGALLGACFMLRSVHMLLCVLIAVITTLILVWVLRRLFCNAGGDFQNDQSAKRESLTAKTASDGAPTEGHASATVHQDNDTQNAGPQLFNSRPDHVDDLKKISGIGPKLEQTLNDIGVYQFAQIASWGGSDIAVVDAQLRFKGRVERDDWVNQAKQFIEII